MHSQSHIAVLSFSPFTLSNPSIRREGKEGKLLYLTDGMFDCAENVGGIRTLERPSSHLLLHTKHLINAGTDLAVESVAASGLGARMHHFPVMVED